MTRKRKQKKRFPHSGTNCECRNKTVCFDCPHGENLLDRIQREKENLDRYTVVSLSLSPCTYLYIFQLDKDTLMAIIYPALRVCFSFLFFFLVDLRIKKGEKKKAQMDKGREDFLDGEDFLSQALKRIGVHFFIGSTYLVPNSTLILSTYKLQAPLLMIYAHTHLNFGTHVTTRPSYSINCELHV